MSLLKIEHQLSLLSEYLQYRLDWLWKNNPSFIIRDYLEMGIIFYNAYAHNNLMTFEQWCKEILLYEPTDKNTKQ